MWGGYYEQGSLIRRSRWITTGGVVECREALVHPGDPHRAVVLRRILAVDGETRLRVTLNLAARFGRSRLRDVRRDGQGRWTGRAGDLRVRFSGAPDARHDDGLHTTVTLEAGQHHDLVLEVSDAPLPAPETSEVLWRATEASWAGCVPDLTGTLSGRDARHAYAVMAGLASPADGTVAAATASLPERAEQGRNYDYRYVWIRDQSFVGQAVAATGGQRLLDDSVRFVAARLLEHGPGLAPAYTTTGRAVPDRRTLDLPGYPGGFDVVGNHVNRQFQLDVFGEALLLLAAGARHDRLDADGRRAALTAADAIAARRRDPDAGIWELHDDHWAHSRLVCAAGLRAIAAVAPRADGGRAAGWEALADTIVSDASATCLHPRGGGSVPPRTEESTRPCSCPPSAAPSRPTPPVPSPPCARCAPTSAATTTSTGSVTTSGRWRTPKARSCCAVSPWRWPSTAGTTTSRRCAGSSGTAPPAVRRACTRRSSTSPSAGCAATFRRPSSTR
ncbi:hypothetical protein GGE06_007789 [Streptomyces sp. SFB5A]|uniref:GH15-like domain-containing protein n=1 Tax=Streptomyces nymphaeiformis TaxID=2663842 RepID=A0A7W7U8H1_9ACTN|nr:glycoside hydrolase family 15 protein [Streptomyces nymphaeiformis]MBB4986818.1 hypothetical protein [Streptomyces nymphaeiformis]